MNMGFAPFGVGNGGSSSSFSNLSPLAPPFTLDRSVTKPLSTPLVDITEPEPEPEFGVGVGVPLNPLQHNWLPSTSKTSAHDFDWLPFSTGSGYPRSQAMMDPSHNHGPLLGRLTITSTDLSSYHGSSDGVTTSMGKPKPYYPSYAATSSNKAGPTVIVDQPSYDWLSNSHVVTFEGPPCTDFSRGSSASERSTEEASHSVDVLDLNKCNDFVREYPNEELFSERNRNIERISNMDAHSAFPGCHPKTRTPPSNPASSSQNSPFLKKPPYLEISREQDSRLNVTTSIVNSPATFSIRPSVVSADSFAWNVSSCHVNSESKEFVSAENYDTCIDKNDPVITEPSSTKIHDLRNNIHSAKDSPDRRLKAGMRLHIPDASPHFSLDPKGIETATTTESSSESFDQYNLASVDSPCWKGVPISQISPFQAFEIVTPSRTKMLEVYNSVNLSLSQVPPSTAEDTVKVIVHEPNESTIGSILEKGATSSPKMPSVFGSSLPAEQKSSNSVKAGEFCSKMGCFHPATSSVYEAFEDGGDFYSSFSIPQDKYKHNLESGKRIAHTSCTEKHADARLNSDNSSGNGLNHLSFDAAEHVKAFHGESTSKVDIRILVDTLHSLSELLLAHCSNGLDALHQKDVISLETVMNNLDVCINSVGSQGSLSSEQRTSQSLEQFHQLHADLGVLKSQSQMTKIEGENLECLSNDRNGVEETNQYILSVKKDKEAAGTHHLRNGIDSMKEDSMTKALKKVLSENFHDDEEHPQTLLFKNLWLQAEAALCASNLRARFNSAKSEMEKYESPKVKEHAKNHNQLFVSGASPGSNTIAKVASKTKVGSTPFVSVQTSPAVSVRSHASDDVITRFNILKHRDDEAKLRDAENSGTLSDFEVSVKQRMVEKSALEKEQSAGPHMKDMDSSFPSSKVKGNDSGPAPRSTSPILTRTSHIDDVMSRFQILKSRDEHVSSLNAGKVQKVTSSHCSEIGKAAPEGVISMIHHPIADNKNEVDDLDGSVVGRLDVLRSWVNNISPTPAGENLQEYWTSVENKVKMEPFLRPEAGKDSRSHFEGKLPAGCSNGSSSDWEHVLWCD
ncbi:uncharacterized protein LOC111449638 isoform X2 [Cucurbita moschata]|uniref:Uncharacterized protein LOC111449638 isoform X2 n=1 Tax=Cucurbita moschata TaxID=3662 RepID=A0A6J1G0S4_CUCMO|nr:uncharacterized protein LOC111449638 isoform X2 [Cucurbita moschata]